MNEEYIRQLAKETFEEQISEEIKKHLDSGIIFKYISDIENELQSYKQKEDKLIKWCYEHGQAINATDILDIIAQQY